MVSGKCNYPVNKYYVAWTDERKTSGCTAMHFGTCGANSRLKELTAPDGTAFPSTYCAKHAELYRKGVRDGVFYIKAEWDKP